MKYIKQFAIIITVSFLGEILNLIIPLPIPASIWGLALMLVLLCLKIVPLGAVKDCATFLVSLMQIMFIPAAVGLIGCSDSLRTSWLTIVISIVLVTPATVCLAIPLYEQLSLLKKNAAAIIVGILSGVITSALCVLVLACVFSLSHQMYVTLLPKSITSAIGMSISEELGGIPSITVAVIILSGIVGNMLAPFFCRIFKITDPIAKGIAVGSSSHAIGTARAIEMGEIEGAMSGLSVAVSGLVSVLSINLFALIY